MAYVYPAILYPEPDGRYSVVFPDLNDLSTFGDDEADALSMAQDACCMNLFNMLKDGEKLPKPSEPQSIHLEDGGFVTLVLCDLDEYARKYNDKAVKKTLSIPAWLNTACEAANINYSKVLQEALIAKIQA